MVLLKQKKSLLLAAVALFVLFGAGIGYYLLSPSSMFAIDVNPSIEIHTNRLGEVVSIDPVNEDAVQLMTGYQLTDKNLETVIHDIVDRMILNGYLVNDKTDAILLSADQNSNSDGLLGKVQTAFNNYLQEKQLAVDVLEQKVDMDNGNVKEAHANNVSVGKMALIDQLTANNSDATTADFTDDTVKELVQYAIDHNISLGDIMKGYHAAAAQTVQTVQTSQTSQTVQTAATDAVTSATVTPTPSAAPSEDNSGATIKISTGKDSKLEDANENDDSDLEDASNDQDDDNSYVKDASKTVKGKEDAENDNDNSDEADSKKADSVKKTYHKASVDKEDSTDAVSGATIKSDKEDGSNVESEDADDNEDGGNYLKEDNEDHNHQGNEAQSEDSHSEDRGGDHGDEGSDD